RGCYPLGLRLLVQTVVVPAILFFQAFPSSEPYTLSLHAALPISGERFGMDEFVRRVSDRGHLAEPNAVYGARVVFEVTGEATQGVLDKVRDTLPAELRPLIDAGSKGEMRT